MSINNYLTSVDYYAVNNKEFEYLRGVLFKETLSIDGYYRFADYMMDSYNSNKKTMLPLTAKKRAMVDTTYYIIRSEQDRKFKERVDEDEGF